MGNVFIACIWWGGVIAHYAAWRSQGVGRLRAAYRASCWPYHLGVHIAFRYAHDSEWKLSEGDRQDIAHLLGDRHG